MARLCFHDIRNKTSELWNDEVNILIPKFQSYLDGLTTKLDSEVNVNMFSKTTESAEFEWVVTVYIFQYFDVTEQSRVFTIILIYI